jgi:hypothetical protein
LRSVVSSQYPSTSQGFSPSHVKVEKRYSHPAQYF